MEPAVPVPYCRSRFTPFSTHEAAEILQRMTLVEVTKEFVAHHQLNPRGEMYSYTLLNWSEIHISKWLVSIFPGVPLPLVTTTPEFCNGNQCIMNLRNCKVRLSNIHCRGRSRGCKCAPFKNCAERLRYSSHFNIAVTVFMRQCILC